MPRRRLTDRERDEAIAAGQLVDTSWMRYARCRLCGRRICVNNYPDRKVRLPKVRGVIVCTVCRFGQSQGARGDGADFLTAMYLFVEQQAHRHCLNPKIPYADRGEGAKVHRCGQCIPCQARKVMKKSPEAKARARKEKRERQLADR